MMIVNDDSSAVSKWSFKLFDDIRVVIYERNGFIIEATEVSITLSANNNQTMPCMCLAQYVFFKEI
jgi:hypothetical protein